MNKTILIGGGIFAALILLIVVKKSQAQPIIMEGGDSAAALPAFAPSPYSFAPITPNISLPAKESNQNNPAIPSASSGVALNLPTVQLPDQNQQTCSTCDAVSRLTSTVSNLTPKPQQQQNNGDMAYHALNPTQAAVEENYEALFGRHAEQAGLDYWSSQVSSGAITMDSLTRSIAVGAQNSDIAAEKARFGDSYK